MFKGAMVAVVLFLNSCPSLAEQYLSPCQLKTNAAYLTNNMQYCSAFWGERNHGEVKKVTDGKHSCIAENWTREKSGKYKSKDFGWVTIKGGKRQGPAEILSDLSHNVEQKLRFNFVDNLLDGKVVVKGQDGTMCNLNFVKDEQIGLQVKSDSKGNLLEAFNQDKKDSFDHFAITMCANGQINSLRCGTQGYLPEDKKFCGFDGEHVTPYYQCSTVDPYQTITFLNGRMKKKVYQISAHELARRRRGSYDSRGGAHIGDLPENEMIAIETTFDPAISALHDKTTRASISKFKKGGIYLKQQFKNGEPFGIFEVHAVDGTLVKKIEFADKGLKRYEEFYLNGAPKIQAIDEKMDGKIKILFRPQPNHDIVIEGSYLNWLHADRSYYRKGDELEASMAEFDTEGGRESIWFIPKERTTKEGNAFVAKENFTEGVLEGASEYHDKVDKTKSVVIFKNGKEISRKVYDLRTGKLVSESELLPDGSVREKKVPAEKI